MGLLVLMDSLVPPKRLRRLLHGISPERCYYLRSSAADDGNDILVQLPDGLTILTPNVPVHDDFVRAYRDVIGQMGEHVTTPGWWATDIASKNRFTSSIPALLERLFSVIQAIESIPPDGVLVVRNVPWVMIATLRGIAEQRGFAIRILARSWIPFWEKRRSLVVSFAYIGREILQTLYRLVIAKMILGKKWAGECQGSPAPRYVVKTFSYDQSVSDSGVYHDPFFGRLPNELGSKTRVVVLSTVLGAYVPLVEKMKRVQDIGVYPLEILVSLWDIFKAVTAGLRSISSSHGSVLFFSYDVRKLINHELSRRSRNIAIVPFLHFFAMQRLVRCIPVEHFLYTYENNPWERMCVLAIKKHSPQTVILGYQHTVVAPAAVNMFVSRFPQEQSLLPTLVLTTGATTTELLERYGDYPRGVLQTSCGLRFESPRIVRYHRTGSDQCVLVAMEGVMQAREMAQYVLRELRGTQYQILLRAHPALPFSSLNISQTLLQSSQVRISSGRSLYDDLQESDYVVYWGSAVSLEAMMIGKPIIHYHTDTLLNYDPLCELTTLKWVVGRHDSLVECLKSIHALSAVEIAQQQEQAQAYIRQYIAPPSGSTVALFFPRVCERSS